MVLLCGHVALQGQVYAMAFGNNTLFTAGQDTTIRVWNLNEQAGIFVSQVRHIKGCSRAKPCLHTGSLQQVEGSCGWSPGNLTSSHAHRCCWW